MQLEKGFREGKSFRMDFESYNFKQCQSVEATIQNKTISNRFPFDVNYI